MIPYHTFPNLPLGLHTFGLFVGAGIIAGALVAKRHLDREGYKGEEIIGFALWASVIGIVGARLFTVLTHWSTYAADPLSVFYLWRGGLEFIGGFMFAAIFAVFWYRRHRADFPSADFLDAASLGLVLGMGIGRWGCISVGEHFGRQSRFFLAVHYLGGTVREPHLGNIPLQEGMSFHNCAIYEMLWCFALFGALIWMRRRGVRPGILAATAGIAYSIARFYFDTLRVNDHRVYGLTGAQYGCILILVVSGFYLWRVLRRPAEPADGVTPQPARRDTDAAEAATAVGG